MRKTTMFAATYRNTHDGRWRTTKFYPTIVQVADDLSRRPNVPDEIRIDTYERSM